jgi:hypothetical protein
MPPPVRPFEPPSLTPPAPARSDAARQAQRAAFFQQFAGQVQAPVAPTVQPVRGAPIRAEPSRQAASAPRLQPITQEPPARIMRPGSFVDIKV